MIRAAERPFDLGAEPRGHRHVYTAHDRGLRGAPGFQTVAHARALTPHLPRIERHVAAFRSPWREDAVDTGIARVDLLPGHPEAVAVTWYQPREAGPTGRPGNFLADTLVVPTAWVSRFAGDVDALLERCPRLTEATRDSILHDAPSTLPPVELLAAAPGSLRRLESLLAHTSPLVTSLIASAMAGQARRPAPVVLVQGADTPPGVLDRIVRLAPLTVPPRLRGRPRTGRLRFSSILTRGTLDDGSTTDIRGVAHDARVDDVGAGASRVVPLDAVPPRRLPEPAAADYACWFDATARRGDWETLERCYRRPEAATADAFLHAFGAATTSPGRA